MPTKPPSARAAKQAEAIVLNALKAAGYETVTFRDGTTCIVNQPKRLSTFAHDLVARIAANLDVAYSKTAAKPARKAKKAVESARQPSLPSDHPDHVCGLLCDGQDGYNSECAKLRRKLFGKVR